MNARDVRFAALVVVLIAVSAAPVVLLAVTGHGECANPASGLKDKYCKEAGDCMPATCELQEWKVCNLGKTVTKAELGTQVLKYGTCALAAEYDPCVICDEYGCAYAQHYLDRDQFNQCQTWQCTTTRVKGNVCNP
jgi:hypothetical protein